MPVWYPCPSWRDSTYSPLTLGSSRPIFLGSDQRSPCRHQPRNRAEWNEPRPHTARGLPIAVQAFGENRLAIEDNRRGVTAS